jgi:L-fucose isomerase-like protein
VNRRRFLQGAALTAAALGAGPLPAADPPPVRVALVFLSNSEGREIWPYPGFDCAARHAEVLGALRKGCPDVDYVPVVVATPADVAQATALRDQVDGYLVYTVTLQWGFTQPLVEIGKLGKPLVIADEFLGGSGVFLIGASQICRTGNPAALVSSTRLDDLVVVARQFAALKQPGMTPGRFVEQCRSVARTTFPTAASSSCASDSVTLTPIGECLQRLRTSRIVFVGTGVAGQEHDVLGAKAIYVGFDELRAIYDRVDQDQAADCGQRWRASAEQVREPTPDWINKAAAVYLATKELMKQHAADSVTMNCLGGFASGQLPAYPCLGFMQLLDDGLQGVCEAMPDDAVSMLMARVLTGRSGYVSDPALDTSKNQIVYAHCMAMTKVFGTDGATARFHIRNLHNRDPRGCCAQSFLPEGYLTTSFRTNMAQKKLVVHQAKAVGNLDSDRGCRTQLVGEVRGDIEKLLYEWDRFGWHRVTLYGDVQEPICEFGRALGLEIVEEA